ncbi:MAG: serine hydrolase domain-containing protein [Polyangiales bacterium]
MARSFGCSQDARAANRIRHRQRKRDLLSLDQKVLATFPELAPASTSDGKEDVELRDLLTMTSGLDCGRMPGEPELYEMIASSNWIEYALSIPMAVAPGTGFAYCSPGPMCCRPW